MSLNFPAFVATRTRTETICDRFGIDDGLPERGGFVYADGCYIEDNSAAPDAGFRSKGKYYLMVDRDEYVSDDLGKLEHILFACHYVWEEPDYLLNSEDGSLDDFIVGWFHANNRDFDGGTLGIVFSGAETFTPREAVAIIMSAIEIYPEDFPRLSPAK